MLFGIVQLCASFLPFFLANRRDYMEPLPRFSYQFFFAIVLKMVVKRFEKILKVSRKRQFPDFFRDLR